MLISTGDVVAWQQALVRLLGLQPNEQTELIDETRRLADQYSLTTHVQSGLELMNLPQRSSAMARAGWLARVWSGWVAVW